MKRRAWVLPTLLSLLLGCSSASTGADTRRYVCAQDDECAVGFSCRAGGCQLGGDSSLRRTREGPARIRTSSFTTAVDRTRAVVFASGQAMNGQAGGEASYSGDDVLGESLAGFEFYSATEIRTRRASALGQAKWTTYVVEFNPP